VLESAALCFRYYGAHMLAVFSWQCSCGMNVKAMYETDGITRIRCPKAFCKITHPVDGKIIDLWIKDHDASKWQPHEVSSLIVH